MKTSLCQILNIELPIIQAPIGSATTPELAASVSNSGGLGMLSITWRDENDIRLMIQQTKALTNKPFGINLVLEFDIADKLQICLDEGVKIISLFWGKPDDYIKLIHQAGAIVIHSVGDTVEARQAVKAGVDVIVAQGWEAGGHVRGKIAAMALIPAVVDAVSPIPVVAAGGIADGRGIVAAMALGASGVWLGTRFLASRQAHIHQIYKDKLLAAKVEDTVYSETFDLGWKNAPHRTMTNSTTQMRQKANCSKQNRPNENEVVAYTAAGESILRYSDTIALPGMQGNLEALALYAGQSVGLIDELQPSADIIATLIQETLDTYKHLKKLF